MPPPPSATYQRLRHDSAQRMDMRLVAQLSDAELDQLLELCRQRLDAFRQQRG